MRFEFFSPHATKKRRESQQNSIMQCEKDSMRAEIIPLLKFSVHSIFMVNMIKDFYQGPTREFSALIVFMTSKKRLAGLQLSKQSSKCSKVSHESSQLRVEAYLH
jgi:hypothetical protein